MSYIIMSFSIFFLITSKGAEATTARNVWEEMKLVLSYTTGGVNFGEGKDERNKV